MSEAPNIFLVLPLYFAAADAIPDFFWGWEGSACNTGHKVVTDVIVLWSTLLEGLTHSSCY